MYTVYICCVTSIRMNFNVDFTWCFRPPENKFISINIHYLFLQSSDKPKAFLTTKQTEQQSGKNIREKDFDAIPIYCAALGAVVLGLLGYVFFKQYSRIKEKKRHKVHDPHDHVEYSRASGTDSGVCVDITVQCKICKQ